MVYEFLKLQPNIILRQTVLCQTVKNTSTITCARIPGNDRFDCEGVILFNAYVKDCS